MWLKCLVRFDNNCKYSTIANYMRFVFAMSVFYTHWYGAYSAQLQGNILAKSIWNFIYYLNAGPIHFGVVGFIVLSGFCIHLGAHDTPNTIDAWCIFYLKRALRIFPVVLLAALLGAIIYSHNLLELIHFSFSVKNIIKINPPLTTVFLELLLYLVYLPLLYLIKKSKWGILFLLAFLFIGWTSPYLHGHPLSWPFDLRFHSLLSFMPYWWLGVLAAEIFRRSCLSINVIVFLVLIIGLFGLGAVLVYNGGFPSFSIIGRHPSMFLILYLYQLFYAIVIALALAFHKSIIYIRYSNWFSSFSYSLYAVHWVVLQKYRGEWSPAQMLISILILAIVSYLLVEKPSHNLARRIRFSGFKLTRKHSY